MNRGIAIFLAIATAFINSSGSLTGASFGILAEYVVTVFLITFGVNLLKGLISPTAALVSAIG